jgi:hypothetical protein
LDLRIFFLRARDATRVFARGMIVLLLYYSK